MRSSENVRRGRQCAAVNERRALRRVGCAVEAGARERAMCRAIYEKIEGLLQLVDSGAEAIANTSCGGPVHCVRQWIREEKT